MKAFLETSEHEEVDPRAMHRAVLLEWQNSPTYLQDKGKMLIEMIDLIDICPTARPSWERILTREKRQMADLILVRLELDRWQAAGFPDPKEWPLSSFCLSQLNLYEATSSLAKAALPLLR